MSENEISRIILDACFKVHRKVGPGLLESAYEELVAYELTKRGCIFRRQAGMPVVYVGVKLELGYRADMIVENKVIVEIKSVNGLADVHFAQLRTYLSLADIRLGLLINFNESLLKDGIKRVVNGIKD